MSRRRSSTSTAAKALAAVAALATASLGGAEAGRDPTCETCQMMAEMGVSGMARLPASYQGSRDVGAMELLEKMCEWNQWMELSGKAELRTATMVDECERLREQLEEVFEEQLVRRGATGLSVREKACLRRGVCDELWAEGDDPDSRESPGDRNRRLGDAYREEYAARDGVKETASGLLYRVLEAGDESSARPTPDHTVKVHYRGTLIDGTEFDSSYSRDEPATFGVTGVIRGWTEALQLMHVGTELELVIPPEIAYGPSGSGDEIGPDATLVFTVKLLEVTGGPGGHDEL